MEYGDITVKDQAVLRTDGVGSIIKVGVINRLYTTAPSTVAYTGVGFKPSNVLFIAADEGSHPTGSFSIGLSANNHSWNDYGAVTADSWDMSAGNAAIRSYKSGGEILTGSVDSMDTDGFTITWTKTNSPTGNLDILYMAFK
jgi:hypothetical protein